MGTRCLVAAIACWMLAALHYFLFVPQLERIPDDYHNEASYNATSRSREGAAAEWRDSTLVARRVEQLLARSASHAIIQGDLHWTNTAGSVEYETSAIFGVDRYTRENLPGFGDTVRTGQFLFPLHTEATSYRYWDPQFIGQCVATYQKTDMLDGLEVHVFQFTAAHLDETAGYSHLPEVPERYHVLSDATGTLRIEPTSGVVVDYEEQGVSYLIEPGSRQRVADIYQWRDGYTGQTRIDKLAHARAERHKIRLLEIWIPSTLLLAGAAAFLAGARHLLPRRAAAALAGSPA